jgi:hypothetical protein
LLIPEKMLDPSKLEMLERTIMRRPVNSEICSPAMKGTAVLIVEDIIVPPTIHKDRERTRT